jgi:hypothetical protein
MGALADTMAAIEEHFEDPRRRDAERIARGEPELLGLW